MAWPAAPLLEEPKNLCTPKVQPVPILTSVCAAGGSRAWQGLVGGTGVGAGALFQPLLVSCAWGAGTLSRLLVVVAELISSSSLGAGGSDTQNIHLFAVCSCG